MNQTLTAWHNDPELKTRTMAALHEDQTQDRYIRGNYAALLDGQWRGCHIGCLVMASTRQINHGTTETLVHDLDSSSWHQRAEDLYGIPRALAYLWDRTYENVPKDDAPAFAVASVQAVPVGADLSLVVSHVMSDLLADPDHGVWQFTWEGSPQRVAVETVAGLYKRRLNGDEPDRADWVKARNDAADAAADAAAYAVADADADVDADVAAAAADDAADAAAAAAWRTHFGWISQRIIHHTQTAPTTAGA